MIRTIKQFWWLENRVSIYLPGVSRRIRSAYSLRLQCFTYLLSVYSWQYEISRVYCWSVNNVKQISCRILFCFHVTFCFVFMSHFVFLVLSVHVFVFNVCLLSSIIICICIILTHTHRYMNTHANYKLKIVKLSTIIWLGCQWVRTCSLVHIAVEASTGSYTFGFYF